MCECGCSSFWPSSKFPATKPREWYFVMVYPGCRDCDAPVGVDIHRMSLAAAREWGIDPDKVPDLPFHADGPKLAMAAIPVLHPRHLGKLLAPHFAGLCDGDDDEIDEEGAQFYVDEALDANVVADAVRETVKPGDAMSHDVEYFTVRNDEGDELPPRQRYPFIPAWYAIYFVALCKTARSLGYALALHGSLQRDCDVVAVPWTDEAVSAEELIAGFAERHGFVRDEGKAGEPVQRPHGRRCWVLRLGGHFYFDVAVMPRTRAAPSSLDGEPAPERPAPGCG